MKSVFEQVLKMCFVFSATTTPRPRTTSAAPVAVTTETPVYENVWFIVLMVVLALIVIFAIIGLILCCTRNRTPYIRQRMPLQTKDKKSTMQMATMEPYDGTLLYWSAVTYR